MALTPVEIRHLQPSTGFMGYKRGPTDRLLVEIAESFEDVWRERADLADKVESLEADLVRFRELEALLRTTLVSAERAAAELKDQARREADLILGEAHAEARKAAAATGTVGGGASPPHPSMGAPTTRCCVSSQMLSRSRASRSRSFPATAAGTRS